eukprot:gnl/MRDRNA2_/MRDRNA2_61251_c0_seq3.p1 gnl/MRDRNA2_/MRDRNA2_61251_c0~~gnl/MRDRNA2_/MRDRNA2_61251_c0_seq3.p1  ORF type:complete len:470 (-),score=89.52 gnl/MRDRNA2_/MRDRNA2_61251_c0_seq3:158-1567(-)
MSNIPRSAPGANWYRKMVAANPQTSSVNINKPVWNENRPIPTKVNEMAPGMTMAHRPGEAMSRRLNMDDPLPSKVVAFSSPKEHESMVDADLEGVCAKRPSKRIRWLDEALIQVGQKFLKPEIIYDIITNTKFLEKMESDHKEKLTETLRSNLHMFNTKQQKSLQALTSKLAPPKPAAEKRKWFEVSDKEEDSYEPYSQDSEHGSADENQDESRERQKATKPMTSAPPPLAGKMAKEQEPESDPDSDERLREDRREERLREEMRKMQAKEGKWETVETVEVVADTRRNDDGHRSQRKRRKRSPRPEYPEDEDDSHQGGDRRAPQRSTHSKKRSSNTAPDLPDLDRGDNGPDSHDLDDGRGPRRKRRNPTVNLLSEEPDEGRRRRKKRSDPEPYSDHEGFRHDSRALERSSRKRHARADRHHDDARQGMVRIQRDEYSGYASTEPSRNLEPSEGRGLQKLRSRRRSHPNP